MYRNPPSNYAWSGFWTDGTPLNFINWLWKQPDNGVKNEVCVNIFSSWYTDCGMGGTYASRRGTWSDVPPTGTCASAVVCELQCTTAQFPIDDCKLMFVFLKFSFSMPLLY